MHLMNRSAASLSVPLTLLSSASYLTEEREIWCNLSAYLFLHDLESCAFAFSSPRDWMKIADDEIGWSLVFFVFWTTFLRRNDRSLSCWWEQDVSMWDLLCGAISADHYEAHQTANSRLLSFKNEICLTLSSLTNISPMIGNIKQKFRITSGKDIGCQREKRPLFFSFEFHSWCSLFKMQSLLKMNTVMNADINENRYV